MATTISNPQTGNFKRIKTRYVAAAGGIALAIAALVTGLSLSDGAPAASQRSVAPAAPASDQAAGSFPSVLEFSHPQVTSPSNAAWYEDVPLLLEPSRPQVAPSSDAHWNETYPSVQEMSHPR